MDVKEGMSNPIKRRCQPPPGCRWSWSVRWLIRLEFLHQRHQGGLGLVDNDDENQDLQHSRFFAKLLRSNHIEAEHQGFLRRGEKFSRWSRKSFEQQMVESGELCSQGSVSYFSPSTRRNKATRQQGNKVKVRATGSQGSFSYFLLQQGATRQQGARMGKKEQEGKGESYGWSRQLLIFFCFSEG